MRRIPVATLALASLAIAAPSAQAHSDDRSLRGKYLYEHTLCDKALGDEPCGRNIVRQEVDRDKDGDTRAATPRELARSIDRYRSWRSIRHDARSAGVQSAASASDVGDSSSAGSSGLDSIAGCESGGDPGAVSGSGQYRGKYQFDRQTWASVGGSGDPAAAPESEQDARAAQLMAREGTSPWPSCGR